MRTLPLLALAAAALVAGCRAGGALAARTRSPLDARPLGSIPAHVSSIVHSGIAATGTQGITVDLPSVLELAGEKPLAIAIAREKLAEADAQVLGAAAGFLPTLAAGSQLARHTGIIQNTNGTFVDVQRQREFHGATAELSLDTGSAVLRYLRDRQRRDAAQEELEAAVEERIASAAAAYFALVGAQSNESIARDALGRAKAFLEISASRERNKVGLPVDRLRAEAEVARARQSVIYAEERSRVASIRLATLLRLDARTRLRAIEAEVHPITFVSPQVAIDDLVAAALANHPDIEVAVARVRAADLDDDAATFGAFFPTFKAGMGGLNGGVGWDGGAGGSLHHREDWYVGVEFRLTGLGLGDVARSRASGARLRAEKLREEETRDRVTRGVLEAFEAIRAQDAAIDVALDEVKAAEEARKIAVKRLEQGTGLAIDVLTADEELTRAATRLIEAIVGYNAAQYQLVSRIGERPGR